MLKSWIKNIARTCLPVYQYESGSERIIYAGFSTIKKNYFIRFLSGNNPDVKFLGRYWFKKIPDLIKIHNIDMCIAEISSSTFNYFRNCRGYVLPVWINGILNIDRPLEEILNHHRFRVILKNISRYNLTYDIVCDNSSFKEFTDHFYFPFISKRHGNEAFIEDLSELWNSSAGHGIMCIKENGITVGMSLFCRSADHMDLLRVGLLDGNIEYRKHGVLSAAYYFSILEGQKMGCRFIDMGASRPFLTDTVTGFKKSLGAVFERPVKSLDEFIWFSVNEDSPFADAFIKNNPFMFLAQDFKLICCHNDNNGADK